MQPSKEFSGLTMPVFSAFGWAGEENALKFALAQLQLFIDALYLRLPPDVRDDFPSRGLSPENQNVYLATGDTYDKDAYIAFNARPMSLEVQLGIVGTSLLSKGLAAVNKDPVAAHHTLTQLDPNWTLRIQQMQIDADTQERAHHWIYSRTASIILAKNKPAKFSRAPLTSTKKTSGRRRSI